jgi:omega-6 fatty acid desaturase (delta-12 desaturase)
VHHLSDKIPNYRLEKSHEHHCKLFTEVTRLNWWQIHGALKNILWDQRSRRIISIAELRRR